jgi:hypothetical protein
VRLVSSATAALMRARAAARACGDPSELADLLLALANRSFGGINNPHNYARVGMGSGTHAVLEALINEIEASVNELIGTEWQQETEQAVGSQSEGGAAPLIADPPRAEAASADIADGADLSPAASREGVSRLPTCGSAGSGRSDSGTSDAPANGAPAQAPVVQAVRFGEPAKRAWVRAALRAHGCTALCLSGGGAVALYHLGVVKELHAQGLLPRVISGTSGGSIVAAMLACHTDAEIPECALLPASPPARPARTRSRPRLKSGSSGGFGYSQPHTPSAPPSAFRACGFRANA